MVRRKTATAGPVVHLTAPDFLLALDMSLTRTGYAVIQLATGSLTTGVLDPGPRKKMERLAWLRDQVRHLAQYGCAKPEIAGGPSKRIINCTVLIEGYAFGARGAAVVSLGELGGVVRLMLHDLMIPYLEVPPMRVKKFLTGKGNIQKDLVLKEVYKKWGADFDDNNIADAFALLQLGLALVDKPTKPLLAFQTAVVEDVLKGINVEYP